MFAVRVCSAHARHAVHITCIQREILEKIGTEVGRFGYGGCGTEGAETMNLDRVQLLVVLDVETYVFDM